jgi:hypothetical protein
MRKGLAPSGAKFTGVEVLSDGARFLDLFTAWDESDGPLPAACEVDLLWPGHEGVVGTARMTRPGGLDVPAGTRVFGRRETLRFRLPDTAAPGEARLLLDLESGAKQNLRLVFRASHDVARGDPSISRYWSGTVDVTIPVVKGTNTIELGK